jgi:hypothetical protein
MSDEVVLSERHQATQQLMRWLVPNQLLQGTAFEVSCQIEESALAMLHILPDGPELSAGLRKLLEAKDCFVRAAVDARDLA